MTAEPAAVAPVLPKALRERIIAEFPKYPEKRAVLLSALHFVQDTFEGWIPKEVVPEVADLLELKPIEVWEVIHFYAMFNSEPVGRCHLRVCTNLSCCLQGARGIMGQLEKMLAVRPGEVTPDGNFSVGEVECLGSCGTAPVIQVNNERYRENLSGDDLLGLLEELRARLAAQDAAKDGEG
ncbi:MAG: NAD(P)H-dependent oxidoreductase subunit E [Candidatus Binatia bacterium]|nr:NAD(P)H-dependent oxidoreductase subunit E [Candidatus Binatia bacterium]